MGNALGPVGSGPGLGSHIYLLELVVKNPIIVKNPVAAKAEGLQSQEEPLSKIKLEASSRKAGASRVKL